MTSADFTPGATESTPGAIDFTPGATACTPSDTPCTPGAFSGDLFAPGPVGSRAEVATGDVAFLQAMLDAEAALTRAQARCGAVPVNAAEAVTAAAQAARYDPRDLALRARAGGNPVIPLIADLTAQVRQHAPAAAEFVHLGATSQDILDTALMLMASRVLEPVLADLSRTAAALAALAARHRGTPMPGRTLTQHAVPTTFGLKAAGWRTLVLDAHDRLTAVRDTLPVQLGGAAGTLSAFGEYARQAGTDPLDLPSAYAAELGLAAPSLPWHTLRAPIADLAGALAFTSGALGKMAADVLVLSRTEIGELTEGAGGSSSAMPHKSNPVRATLIVSAARQVPSLAAVLYASLVAEDERPAGAWHAEWQPLRDALRLTGGAARGTAELAAGLRVHPDRMRANLDRTGGLIVSERLSAVLTPLLGRVAAKETLTRAATYATEQGTDLSTALAREPAVVAALTASEPPPPTAPVTPAAPTAPVTPPPPTAPVTPTAPSAPVAPDDAEGRALAVLRDLTDPTRYLGSAPALVDRALTRSERDRRSHPGGAHPGAAHPEPALPDPAHPGAARPDPTCPRPSGPRPAGPRPGDPDPRHPRRPGQDLP